MGYPPTATYTVSAGDTILADHYNTQSSDWINANIPEDIDDYSVSVAEMRSTADPYPSDVASLATTLSGELERLRYVIAQITGETYHYVDPVASLAQITAGYVKRSKFVYVESIDYTSGGTHEVLVGDTLTGATGGGTGVVVALTLTSGTWAGGDAAGTLYLNTRNATAFQAENLNEGANSNVCTIGGASSKNAVVLKAGGVYDHNGTDQQTVYWTSDIAFEFANLGTSDWSYLYLDDSAIVTADTNVISSTELVDSVTEPTERYDGRYNGNDRCILGVLTDGSDNIIEFYHDGESVVFADDITTNISASDVNDSFVDCTLTIPSFATLASVGSKCAYNSSSTAAQAHWRTNGQTGTTGHYFSESSSVSELAANSFNVITDSSGVIEVKFNQADDHLMTIETVGWYFPIGM